MKKILMTIVAAFAALSMNAQVYVGGEIGFASEKVNDSETTFKFIPEIGYNFNEDWAAGIKIGYQKACNLIADYSLTMGADGLVGKYGEAFTVSPYARYTFVKTGSVKVFVDGGLDFTSVKDIDDNIINVGLKPGVAVDLSDSFSFVAHFGFVGYKSWGDNLNKIGVDLNGNNLTFGLYYNF